MTGSFGLIPHWASDTKIARNTYNARLETVSEKPSYRDAWREARKCIIPANAIYEPDWRSGRAMPARISRADGKPMGIAGLWSQWQSPTGEIVHSYTMLTINADQHPLMRNMHKPDEEKRMVTILHEHQYSDWLNASMADSRDFLREYPAELLHNSTSPPDLASVKQASLF
jgi:putative SOS response-associated peptidase YedK